MSFLGNLFGMGGDPNAMKLPGTNDAANSALGGISGLANNNTYQSVLPNIGNLTGQRANNPYAGGLQDAANGAAGLGNGTAQAVGQGAQGIGGLTSMIVPYAQQILQNGFDPQNALYGRAAQQLTDQTRAGQSARGIAMSPYGASLENQALSNFNLDWQDRQLGRQNTALGGFNSAVQGGVGAGQGALGLGQGAQDLSMRGAATPYSTYNDIINNAVGAYGAYGQAGQNANIVPGQQIGNWLSYVGQGNAANQNAIGQQKQNQSFFGDFLTGVGAIAGF